MQFIKHLLVIILLLIVVAFGVLFSIQNNATAPLDLLLIQLPEQRVSLWVLLAFIVGGSVGVLMSGAAIVRLKSRVLLLQRKLDKYTKELSKSSGASIGEPVSKG